MSDEWIWFVRGMVIGLVIGVAIGWWQLWEYHRAVVKILRRSIGPH